MTLAERISKVLSEILSDKYDAKITIVFKDKEVEPNVPSVPTDTVQSTVS